MEASPLPPLTFSHSLYILFGLSYLTLVAFFRNRYLRSTLVGHAYQTRTSFASMTNEDAFLIQLRIAELDFPFTFEKSLQFALFRTYGIPSISKLLVQTSQFSEARTATKRYADTTVLLAEFLGYHPTNARSIEAIARMNYIHSQYQKPGKNKIKDDDLLYTLALFAGEPTRWIDQYEWRKLEDFEKCAIGTFWKAIGDAMGIGYENLRSGTEGGAPWTDGLQWLDELNEWSAKYEERYMVPDKNNQKTAEQTVAILLYSLPKSAKPYGRRIVSALMDDRLRTAMMYVFNFLHPRNSCLTVFGPGSRNLQRSSSYLSPPFSRSAKSLCAISRSLALNSSVSTRLPMSLHKPARTILPRTRRTHGTLDPVSGTATDQWCG